MHIPRNLLVLAALALLLPGCPEDVPSGFDPEPTDVESVNGGDAGVTLGLELGFYYGPNYKKFLPGDDCPIAEGLQGGTWTMPAVRMIGFSTPITIKGSIVTDAGEVLGEVDQRQSFNTNFKGWLETRRLPIPIESGEFSIEELYGQAATLTLTVADFDGHSVKRSVKLVLVEGEHF